MTKKEKLIIWELLRGYTFSETLGKLTSIADESDEEFVEYYCFTKLEARDALSELFESVKPTE